MYLASWTPIPPLPCPFLANLYPKQGYGLARKEHGNAVQD